MRVPKVVAVAARTVPGLIAHSSRAGRVAGLGLLIGLLVGFGPARRSLASHARAAAAPSRLTARAEGAAVRLRWRAPARGRVGAFRIERGGRPIARVSATRRTYADRHVRPGHAYRYAVRALFRGGARSASSPGVRVTVPSATSRSPSGGGAPGGATGVPPAVSPAPPLAGGSGPAGGVAPTTSTAPTADLPGWQHVFADDFSTAAPSFPGPAYAARWWAYPSGSTDTSRSVGRPTYEQGHYDCARTCSVSGGVLRLNLHSEAGAPYVAAPVPRLPGSSGGVSSTPSGQLYGRYSVRFRATASGPGYKTAWLLWPDSRNWPADGEIDYPEGSLDGGFAGFVHHQAGTSGADQKRIPSTGSAASYGAWHVATIEWSPGRVEFFLDDRSLGSETARVPNTPMHWVLQSETEVTATPTPDTSSANIEIDWVSVWKPSGSSAGSGSGAGPAPVPSPAPVPASPGDTVTLAAVGDTCSGTACSQASATAQTVRNIAPFRFLHVGDFQYQNAGAGGVTFTSGYETAFAGLHAITLPAFGATHDTEDGSGAWEGYPVSFFDANGAPEAQGKLSDHQWGYSYDLGAWHVVAIDYKSGDVASVEADLAAHPSACLMAVSHAPAFGSPSAEHPTNEALAYRDVLFRHGVDLIVSGHQHFYERLGPVDSAGAPDPNGATQLIVGLGGIGHYGRTSTAPESRVYNATAFGPTRLTLTPGGWSSEFVPDAGSPAFADTAGGTCAD